DARSERTAAAADPILPIHLETPAGSDTGDGRWRDHENESLAQRLHLGPQAIEDSCRVEPGLHALVEWLQRDENDPRIWGGRESCPVEACECDSVLDAGPREQQVGRLAHDLVR